MTDCKGNTVKRPIEIFTKRFHLRELTESDATVEYLSWLADPVAQKFITAAHFTSSLPALRAYIRERAEKTDILFWGIFDGETQKHIGNIKYEPIDTDKGYAVMGVLIGDKSRRGQGVFPEVFNASAQWLHDTLGISHFELGVDRTNSAAIRSYQKTGFTISEDSYLPSTSARLVLRLMFHDLT